MICRLLLAGGLGRLKDMQLKYIYKLCQFLPHPLGKNNVFGFFLSSDGGRVEFYVFGAWTSIEKYCKS